MANILQLATQVFSGGTAGFADVLRQGYEPSDKKATKVDLMRVAVGKNYLKTHEFKSLCQLNGRSFWALAVVQAAMESSFDPGLWGDNDRSGGLFQFYDPTVQEHFPEIGSTIKRNTAHLNAEAYVSYFKMNYRSVVSAMRERNMNPDQEWELAFIYTAMSHNGSAVSRIRKGFDSSNELSRDLMEYLKGLQQSIRTAARDFDIDNNPVIIKLMQYGKEWTVPTAGSTIVNYDPLPTNMGPDTYQTNVIEAKATAAAGSQTLDLDALDQIMIGDIIFKVPLNDISFSESEYVIGFESLRTAGRPKIISDHVPSQVVITLTFPDVASVNNELRPLIAMAMRTPFVPVFSKFLVKTLKPEVQEIGGKITMRDAMIVMAIRSVSIRSVDTHVNLFQAAVVLDYFEAKCYGNLFMHKTMVSALGVIRPKDEILSMPWIDQIEYAKTYTKSPLNLTIDPRESEPFRNFYRTPLNQGSDPYLDKYDPEASKSLSFVWVNGDGVTSRHLKFLNDHLNDLYMQQTRGAASVLDLIGDVHLDPNKRSKYHEDVSSFISLQMNRLIHKLEFTNQFRKGTQTLEYLHKEIQRLGHELQAPKVADFLNSYVKMASKIIPGMRTVKEDLYDPHGLETLNAVAKFLETATKADGEALRKHINNIGLSLVATLAAGVEPESGTAQFPAIKLTSEELNLTQEGSVITGIMAVFDNKIVPINISEFERPSFQHVGRGDFRLKINIRTTKPEMIRKIFRLIRRTNELMRLTQLNAPTILQDIDTTVFLQVPPGHPFRVFGIGRITITSVEVTSVDGAVDAFDIAISAEQSDLPFKEKITTETKTKIGFANALSASIAKDMKVLNPDGTGAWDVDQIATAMKSSEEQLRTVGFAGTDIDNFLVLRVLAAILEGSDPDTAVKKAFSKSFIPKEGSISVTKIARALPVAGYSHWIEATFNRMADVPYLEDSKQRYRTSGLGSQLSDFLSTFHGTAAQVIYDIFTQEPLIAERPTMIGSLTTPEMSAFGEMQATKERTLTTGMVQKILKAILPLYQMFVMDDEILNISFDPKMVGALPAVIKQKVEAYIESRRRELSGSYPDFSFRGVTGISDPINLTPNFYFYADDAITDVMIQDANYITTKQIDRMTQLGVMTGLLTLNQYQELKDRLVDIHDPELQQTMETIKQQQSEINKAFDGMMQGMNVTAQDQTKAADRMVTLETMRSQLNADLLRMLISTKVDANANQEIRNNATLNSIKSILSVAKDKSKKWTEMDDFKTQAKESKLGEGYELQWKRSAAKMFEENKLLTQLGSNRPLAAKYWGFEDLNTQVRAAKQMEAIADTRIKEVFRNNIKMFPTFKLYFIEEDAREWAIFDDLYSYSAVRDISIVSDKRSASSTCTIQLSNIGGNLTDPWTENTPARNENILGRNVALTSMMLKPGTTILLKLGYENNPMFLPTRFYGKITEINPGPVVDIIAQSFGAELNTVIGEDEPIKFGALGSVKGHGDVVTEILNYVPGLEHLGKKSYIKTGDRDSIRERRWESGFWRDISKSIKYNLFVNKLIGTSKITDVFFRTNDPRDDNVFLPYSYANKMSTFASHFANITFDWVIYAKSAWDAIWETAMNHTDNIVTLLPYNENLFPVIPDFRYTLYVGPKNGYYKYTDSFGYSGKIGNKEGVQLFLDGMSALVQKWENRERLDRDTSIDLVNRCIAYYMKHFIYVKQLFMPVLTEETLSKCSEESMRVTADFVVSSVMKGYLRRRRELNRDVNAEDVTVSDLSIDFSRNIGETKSPRFKKVVEHHLISSYRDIINNNIAASTEEMSNVVHLVFPKNPSIAWAASPNPGDSKSHTVMADDDLNSDIIKEKYVYSPNIDPSWVDDLALVHSVKAASKEDFRAGKLTSTDNKGWNSKSGKWDANWNSPGQDKWLKYPSHYKVANNYLATEVSKMYTGDVTIIGNPHIKPWDVLHIVDDKNDMSGAVEVDRVIHHFNAESGYTTVIRPNLLTHVRDPQAMQDTQYVGEILSRCAFSGWLMPGSVGVMTGGACLGLKIASKSLPFLGKVTSILSISNPIVMTVLATVALLLGAKAYGSYIRMASTAIGKMFGREVIDISPLMLRGEPYVAGLDGMYKNKWLAHCMQMTSEGSITTRIGYALAPLEMYFQREVIGNKDDLSLLGILLLGTVTTAKIPQLYDILKTVAK